MLLAGGGRDAYQHPVQPRREGNRSRRGSSRGLRAGGRPGGSGRDPGAGHCGLRGRLGRGRVHARGSVPDLCRDRVRHRSLHIGGRCHRGRHRWRAVCLLVDGWHRRALAPCERAACTDAPRSTAASGCTPLRTCRREGRSLTMTTAVPTYPVHVNATLDTQLSRWLWLVKWFLAIPHYVVLVFLWISFIVVSIVAFFAILFTGSYPRGIFEFNVGVLRWTWRVQYYTFGALATDRY